MFGLKVYTGVFTSEIHSQSSILSVRPLIIVWSFRPHMGTTVPPMVQYTPWTNDITSKKRWLILAGDIARLENNKVEYEAFLLPKCNEYVGVILVLGNNDYKQTTHA